MAVGSARGVNKIYYSTLVVPPVAVAVIRAATASALSTPLYLVRDLSGLYDFVLIDSPPALRYTDAALLAAACDGAVLIARSGRTRTTDLAKVSQKMGLVDATVLGAVLVGAKSTDR